MDGEFLNGRYELIDGEIISKMGQNARHRMTWMIISSWLASIFGSLCVQEQGPIHLPGEAGIYTEPEPDVAVTLEPTSSYADQHPEPQDLRLAVEVSDTTLRFDTTVKALVYARAGICEYWVADVLNRRIIVHLLPHEGGYRSVSVFDEDSEISLSSHPEATVAVRDLLPPLNTATENR
jgi:Uma2 family endonuclease